MAKVEWMVPLINRKICLRVLPLKRKVITLKLRHIEISTFFSVQLSHILTRFKVAQQKSLKTQTCFCYKKKHPVQLKRLSVKCQVLRRD